MKQVVLWALHRGTCTLLGHNMEAGRFFYGPAKDIVPGYVCERCGRTQLSKRRWQT